MRLKSATAIHKALPMIYLTDKCVEQEHLLAKSPPRRAREKWEQQIGSVQLLVSYQKLKRLYRVAVRERPIECAHVRCKRNANMNDM